MQKRNFQQSDTEIEKPVGRRILFLAALIALGLWILDSLLHYFCYNQSGQKFWEIFLELNNLHHFLTRCVISLWPLPVSLVIIHLLKREKRIAENLRVTLHSIGDGVIVADTQGLVQRINPVAEKLTGYASCEAAGRPVSEVFHIINSKTGEVCESPVEKVIRKGSVVGLANHTMLISRDGHKYQIADSGAPVRDSRNAIVGVVMVFRDVTEEYRLQEQISDSEQLLANSFDAIQDGISILDPDLTIVRTNKWMERMYSDSMPLKGKKCYEVYQQRDSVCPWCPCLKTLEQGVVFTETVPYPSQENPTGWIELSAFPRKDVLGNIIGVIEYVKDVTGQKTAEKALRESEERFRYLSELSLEGILIYENGVLIEGNKAIGRIFGYKLDELIGLNLIDLLATKESARIIHKQVASNSNARYEVQARKRDGSVIDLQLESRRIRYRGRSVRVAFVRDITELKSAHKKLERSESRYRSFVQNFNGIAFRGTTDFVPVFFHGAVEEVTGYSEEEILSGNPKWNEIVHPDDRSILDSKEKILADPDYSTRREYRIRRKDGEVRWVYESIQRYDDETFTDVFVQGAIHDITPLKRAEQEHIKMEKKIQETQKLESLGVLAGGIAHDFNNILMGIMGYADLAADMLPEMSPVRENIQEIEKASHRAAELCRQMLAYSGRGSFVIESIDVGSLVEEMLHLLKTSISKKVLLNLSLEKELPRIKGDATQIRQTVMNIVINASEAIGERSGVITISTGAMECTEDYISETLHARDLAPGYYVYVEVSDTGCGMDRKTQDRLFEPFFTTKFDGRGLGMAAVLGIIQGHNGAIKVYSELGKGTTFKMLFPVAEGADLESPDISKIKEEEFIVSGNVLLVDDEETVRAVGKRMLQRLGLTVITAENGRQAVDIFTERKEEIALVILDITMPEMTGEEAYREIRRLGPDVAVIMSSGYTEQETSARFSGKGVNGFIQKPYTLGLLRERLGELFRKR